MSISIIIAALVSNILTSIVKPAKKMHFDQETLDARKTAVRAISAMFGLIMLLVSTHLLGEDLPQDQVGAYVELIIGTVVTYLSSQQVYTMVK